MCMCMCVCLFNSVRAYGTRWFEFKSEWMADGWMMVEDGSVGSFVEIDTDTTHIVRVSL